MSDEPKDKEKAKQNNRRYLETIADLKKYQDAKKVEEELARQFEKEK